MVLRNVSKELLSAGETVYLKTTKWRAHMKILPFVTQSHPALPNLKNKQMGNDTLKLTLIFTPQMKVIKRYPNNC